jgi:hypothetical protein
MYTLLIFLCLQVEETSFNVRKQQLLKSETFKDMFNVSNASIGSGGMVEGASIENPIKLDGVSASDFESLLIALYSQ